MQSTIQPHNERIASVWNSGGSNYDNISRGICRLHSPLRPASRSAARRAYSRPRNRYRLDITRRCTRRS